MDKRPNNEKSALEHNMPAVFHFIIEKVVQELPSRIFIKMDLQEEFVKINANYLNAWNYSNTIKINSGGLRQMDSPHLSYC